MRAAVIIAATITTFSIKKEGVNFMSDFKVGDRVRILPGVATPFVGMDGTISEVRPHERGIETMDRHVVVFERREKRSFYGVELMRIQK